MRTALLIAAAALLAACESAPPQKTTVDRVLIAPNLDSAPYRHILVVGATPTRELDRMIEEGMTQHLRERGVQTVSFVRASSATRPSEEAVYALVQEKNVDGVIVMTTRFVGGQVQKRDEQVDMNVQRSVRGGGLLDYFRYNYREDARPSYADSTLDVRIASDFYDAKTQARVYAVESSTTYGRTGYEIVMSESKAIVARMKKDGLIQ